MAVAMGALVCAGSCGWYPLVPYEWQFYRPARAEPAEPYCLALRREPAHSPSYGPRLLLTELITLSCRPSGLSILGYRPPGLAATQDHATSVSSNMRLSSTGP